MKSMQMPIPDDACGKAGAFFNVFMTDAFGAVIWCATFEGAAGFEDAIDVADDMARTHKTQAWVMPAFYTMDGRENEEAEESTTGKICHK